MLDRNLRPASDETRGKINPVERIREIARELFTAARGSHDWDHTQRVAQLCERIGPAEGADMTVLRIAACLHDIGRSRQDRSCGDVCHAVQGAEMAGPLLADLPLTEAQKANVLHCIRTHRFRNHHVPETIEARVLFDADKLDAIGAVGVARAFLFAGEVGACLHNAEIDVTRCPSYSANDTGYREYRVKLRKIRSRILTPTGEKLAESRHEFMTGFFDRFLAEYQGRM